MDTVWGDLLFFVNFCMDFQCLFLTAKLLHRPFPVWRSALFSALGALYAVAALFITAPGGLAFFADCAVCFLMCVGTFTEKKCNTVSVFLPFLVYFGVSFAVGGAMSGIGALLSRLDLPIAPSGQQVSGPLFFLLAAAGGLCTFLWGRTSRRRAGQLRARLRVSIGKEVLSLSVMVDTANLLTDPISGRPVVLVAKGALDALLSLPLAGAVRKGAGAVGNLPHEDARRVRLLAAQSATGQGLLVAIAPDWARLDLGRGEVGVEILLAPTALRVGFDDCQALLPAELVRGL